MADTKLSALASLGEAPATDDELYIRDISVAAADESKRLLISDLILAMPVTALNNATANALVTVGATTTQLEAEANLTYDGANALALQVSASGAEVNLLIKNTNTDTAASAASIDIDIVSSSTGDAFLVFASSLFPSVFGVDNSNGDRTVIAGRNNTPGGNDAIRITNATPPVATYNTTHPTGTFDYVCSNCGKHRHEQFRCCGSVEWHDDLPAVRAAMLDIMTMKNPYAPGQSLNVQHMVDLGVFEYDDEEEDPVALANRACPWLGINIKSAQWFTWAAMWQNRERMDAFHANHEQRIQELEMENQRLRELVGA
jgi:hypothetical protein